MTGDDDLGAWLRLLLSPGIGRDTARRLLAAFGSPQAIFDAAPAARRTLLPAGQPDTLAERPEAWAAQVEAAARWLDGAATGDGERRVVTLGDPLYPAHLLETADPPLLLFLHGRAELLARSAIAVVGSRNPTPQGRENAQAFAAHLSRAGWTIVSGLALGIDGAAHEGALAGDGSTIAVLGTGVDRIYPARHEALARRIAAAGLLVSEFPLGTPPLAPNFPLRNRLIAGLASGTLVVEAAVQSGSLITARLAVEAGREVFAIPGSIHSPLSRGCHALIKQGAKLVETADDVLAELRPAARPAAAPAQPADDAGAPSHDPVRDPVLDALGHDPATLDAIGARTGWPAAELAARLLELELEGRVRRLPGGLFQRCATA
jgi:DNA processing protein